MAKIRKPKLAAYPKQPKMKASLEAWKSYEAKVKDVDKKNQEKVKEYKSKVAAAEAAVKTKAAIQKKVKGLSGVKF